jgi:predicted Fe-S protein YdhL (DUF1289 family)
MPTQIGAQMRLDGSCILTIGMSLEETVRWNKLNKQERQKLLDLLSGRLTESVKVSRTKLEEEMNVIRAILAGTTPPSNNTDTSNAAAKVVAPKYNARAERMYKMILEKGINGATDEEGQLALGMSGNSYRPVRGNLVKLCMIVDSGLKRETVSGNPAKVWVSRAALVESDAQ